MTYSRDFARGGERLRVTLKHLGDHRYRVDVGDTQYEVTARALPDGRVRFLLDGDYHEASAAPMGKAVQVRVGGDTFVLDPFRSGAAAADHGEANGDVEAPMTGTVLKLPVAAGTAVKVGETVVILSAMKMEHKLGAGIDGEVVDVCVAEGEAVDQGTLLLRIQADVSAGAPAADRAT